MDVLLPYRTPTDGFLVPCPTRRSLASPMACDLASLPRPILHHHLPTFNSRDAQRAQYTTSMTSHGVRARRFSCGYQAMTGPRHLRWMCRLRASELRPCPSGR